MVIRKRLLCVLFIAALVSSFATAKSKKKKNNGFNASVNVTEDSGD